MPGIYPFNPYALHEVDGVATRFVQQVYSVSAASGPNLSFIVPNAAPFFSQGLVVRRQSDNVILTLGVDYILTHRFVEASHSTGKQIYGSIAFLDRNFSQNVKVTYITLGGEWVLDDNTIITSLTNTLYTIQTVTWEQITGMPVAFPPIVHDHEADDLTGMADVIAKLEEIRLVMVANYGNTAAFTNQLNDHITNPSAHGKAQVGLGNVDNYPTADEAEALAGAVGRFMTAQRVQQKINSLGLQNGATTLFTIGPGSPVQPLNQIELKNGAFQTVSLPSDPPAVIPDYTLPLKNGAFMRFVTSETAPGSPEAGMVWFRPIT